MHNLEEIVALIALQMHPRVMVFVETHVTQDISLHEMKIESFKLVRCNTTNSRTGGVAMYVHNRLKVTEIANVEIDRNVWMIIIKVDERLSGEIVLCAMYHSPSTSDAVLIEVMTDVGEMLMQHQKVIIMGDFNLNVDSTRKEYYAVKLLSILGSYGFKQYVTDYTRVTQTSKTIIDMVFSNINIMAKPINTPRITDHCMLEITTNTDICRKA